MIELVDVRLDHPGGGSPLVADATFAVARGQIALVIGAAGVGTSRLVAAALGEAAMVRGRIEVFGRDVAKLRRASLRLLRRRIGIVPQDLCLLEDRSAQLNVVLPLEIDGIPRSMSVVRAATILGQLGLESEASLPVDCLAMSARQRVAVARALVRDPELVIADHPTSWQDAAGAELVAGALMGAAAAGASCLVFGRDPALREIAEREGWRQLAIVDGRIIPLGEIALAGAAIDELLVDSRSVPVRPASEDESLPNVLPFPTAGVA